MNKHSQKGEAALVMVVLMVAVMAGGMWFSNKGYGGHHQMWHGAAAQSESALEILDKAYARGEIGREEYLRKREDLERGAAR